MRMNTPMPTLPRAAWPIAITVLALLALIIGAQWLRPNVDRSVLALQIEGNLYRVNAVQVAAAAAIGDAHLFEVDINALRDRVEALPWVAHARVSRIWPDRIAIRIAERVPFARWGETQLIDTESRVFSPPLDEIPAELPQLSAPNGREAETSQTFEKLRRALTGGVLVPTGLDVDARGERRLATARGIEIRLGQDDPLAKIPLLLGAVSRAMNDQWDRVAYLDLRYSNGFSVGWIDGGACESAQRLARNPRQKAAADTLCANSLAAARKVGTKAEVRAGAKPNAEGKTHE